MRKQHRPARRTPPDFPPLVHTSETSLHSPPIWSEDAGPSRWDDVAWRHRGEGRYRSRIISAYHHLMLHDDKINRFVYCGHSAIVVRRRDGEPDYAVVANRCHDRWCKACSKDRSLRVGAAIANLIGDRPARFITLTYRSTPADGLGTLLDGLHDAFTRLRRCTLWMACVTHAVAVVETKWKPDTNRWHVHLHIIARGRYLAQDELSRQWHRVTGHSYVVDVRAVRSPQEAAKYLGKYVTKAVGDAVTHDQERLVEAIKALKGSRLVATYGLWRGVPLLGPVTTAADWEFYDTLNEVFHRARNGSDVDRRLVCYLTGNERDGYQDLSWDTDDTPEDFLDTG